MQPYNPSNYGDTGGYHDHSKHVLPAAPPAPPDRVRVSSLARSSEAYGSFYDGGRWQLRAEEAPRVVFELNPAKYAENERVWRKEWIRRQQAANEHGGNCAGVAARNAGSHPGSTAMRESVASLMHGKRRSNIKCRRWHVRHPPKQQAKQRWQQADGVGADRSRPRIAIDLESTDQRRFTRIPYDEWLRRKRQQQRTVRATTHALEHAHVESERKRQERVSGAFEKWRAKKQRESARVRAEARKLAEVKKQEDEQQQERHKARRARAERLSRKLSAKRRRCKRARDASIKPEQNDAPADTCDNSRLAEEAYIAWLKCARRRDAQRAAEQRRQRAMEAQQRLSARKAKWRKKEIVLCYTQQLASSITMNDLANPTV